ncbi:MAG: hypothetical protein LUE10_02050 [Alistipes sp.]|nr:hypothetical protein [Alistipes sp.]
MTFRADGWKWTLRNLKVLGICIAVALPSWWLFWVTGDFYFIVFAATASFMGVLFFIAGMVQKPRLGVGDGEVKYGTTVFRFADVVDVRHKGFEYTFFLASRRRVTGDVAYFCDRDKKAVDTIFARECKHYLSREEVKGKIAGSSDISPLCFTVRAKRSLGFHGLCTAVWIITFFAVTMSLLSILAGGFKFPDAFGPAVIIVVTLTLSTACRARERKIEKALLDFDGNTFTLSRKGRNIFSFPRTEVAGVGIFTDQRNYISFRMKSGKRVTLKLASFGRKDARMIIERVRSIFFLPQEDKRRNIFKKI